MAANSYQQDGSFPVSNPINSSEQPVAASAAESSDVHGDSNDNSYATPVPHIHTELSPAHGTRDGNSNGFGGSLNSENDSSASNLLDSSESKAASSLSPVPTDASPVASPAAASVHSPTKVTEQTAGNGAPVPALTPVPAAPAPAPAADTVASAPENTPVPTDAAAQEAVARPPAVAAAPVTEADFDPTSCVFEGLEILQKFTRKSSFDSRFIWISLPSRTIHMSQYMTKERRHKEASLTEVTSIVEGLPAKLKRVGADSTVPPDPDCFMTINFNKGGGIDLQFRSKEERDEWLVTLRRIMDLNAAGNKA